MQFLFQKMWELLLPIPMPWQIILIFFLAMPFVPWLMLRCLPWILVKLLQVLVIFTEFIVQSFCFLEYKITQNIRKRKQKPPEILYILSDVLVGSVRIAQFFKINSERLYLTMSDIPWILRQKGWYTLPVIFLPIWFVFPHLNNSSLTILINSGVTWWCSLEHWAMTSKWTPSNLTCRYPNSPPRWDTFLKAKEYKLKKEIREYTRKIELQTSSSTTYYNRGNTYLNIENIDAAYQDYTSSVKITPTFAPGYVGRGNIYLIKKDKSGAFKEYTKAISVDSKYAPGYSGRGDVYLAMNENSLAFKEYSTSINLNSKYAPGYVGRGDVYQKVRDKEAALQEYRKAIDIDPKYGIAYKRMGNLYYRNFGDFEAAIEKYERAASLFLRSGKINSYNEVTNILNQLNSYIIYTVKRGDSLSKIAENHDVFMQTIISVNKKTYPKLVENPSDLEIGWKLRIPLQRK